MRLTKLTFEVFDPQTGKRYTRVLDGEDVDKWNDYMLRVCYLSEGVGAMMKILNQYDETVRSEHIGEGVAALENVLTGYGIERDQMNNPKWHELHWMQTEIETPRTLLGEILEGK